MNEIPNLLKEKNDCKASIQALLVSTPDPVSLAELRKDYFDMGGSRIPYLDFGFVYLNLTFIISFFS